MSRFSSFLVVCLIVLAATTAVLAASPSKLNRMVTGDRSAIQVQSTVSAKEIRCSDDDLLCRQAKAATEEAIRMSGDDAIGLANAAALLTADQLGLSPESRAAYLKSQDLNSRRYAAFSERKVFRAALRAVRREALLKLNCGKWDTSCRLTRRMALKADKLLDRCEPHDRECRHDAYFEAKRYRVRAMRIAARNANRCTRDGDVDCYKKEWKAKRDAFYKRHPELKTPSAVSQAIVNTTVIATPATVTVTAPVVVVAANTTANVNATVAPVVVVAVPVIVNGTAVYKNKCARTDEECRRVKRARRLQYVKELLCDSDDDACEASRERAVALHGVAESMECKSDETSCLSTREESRRAARAAAYAFFIQTIKCEKDDEKCYRPKFVARVYMIQKINCTGETQTECKAAKLATSNSYQLYCDCESGDSTCKHINRVSTMSTVRSARRFLKCEKSDEPCKRLRRALRIQMVKRMECAPESTSCPEGKIKALTLAAEAERADNCTVDDKECLNKRHEIRVKSRAAAWSSVLLAARCSRFDDQCGRTKVAARRFFVKTLVCEGDATFIKDCEEAKKDALLRADKYYACAEDDKQCRRDVRPELIVAFKEAQSYMKKE